MKINQIQNIENFTIVWDNMGHNEEVMVMGSFTMDGGEIQATFSIYLDPFTSCITPLLHKLSYSGIEIDHNTVGPMWGKMYDKLYVMLDIHEDHFMNNIKQMPAPLVKEKEVDEITELTTVANLIREAFPEMDKVQRYERFRMVLNLDDSEATLFKWLVANYEINA